MYIYAYVQNYALEMQLMPTSTSTQAEQLIDIKMLAPPRPTYYWTHTQAGRPTM